MTHRFGNILGYKTLRISSPLVKALIRFSRFPAHNTMASQPAAQAPATTPEPKWKRNTAYVKPDEQLGEGDTTLIKDFLPESITVDAFEKLKEEVQWHTMHHHGEHAPVVRFTAHQATRWRGSAASRRARRDPRRWVVGTNSHRWFIHRPTLL